MNSKIVLLNGPIGCGKTDLSNVLVDSFGFTEKRCKDKLHELTKSFFCVAPDIYESMYSSRYLKETPSRIFNITWGAYEKLCKALGGVSIKNVETYRDSVDLSLRLAMIYVSEVICKPTFGNTYFGKARAASIEEGTLVVDDSVGFAEELGPTVDKLGQKNCLLVRVHGRGTFEGDSRSYIEDGVVNNTIDIYNSGTLQEFLTSGVDTVSEWVHA